MKDCVECGKKLGIIEGYRHPTLGKEYLLCSTCFDTVTVSVDKWRAAVSSYAGFFHTETVARNDLQKIENRISKQMRKTQNKAVNEWSHKDRRDAQEAFSSFY